MNEILRQPKRRPTTQAAEGVPRLRWTVAEFERLGELGVFNEDDRIELIGGELVPMSPKGNRHELVKTRLLNWIMRRLPDDLEIAVELGWRPSDDTYLEPDILVYTSGRQPSTVAPVEVRLAIEIAHSSLSFDSGPKSRSFADLGVREYWVVNAISLETRVHREPAPGGYGDVADVSPTETLTPHLLPAMAVRLADLDLG